MNLLKRQLICDRLRLNRRSSYRVVFASRLSLISSDDVLEILNRSRRPLSTKPLSDIPSDLLTPEEMASEIGGVTAHMLLNWTRRTKNVAPHFRLNKHTTRFSRSALLAWLDERVHTSQCHKRVA